MSAQHTEIRRLSAAEYERMCREGCQGYSPEVYEAAVNRVLAMNSDSDQRAGGKGLRVIRSNVQKPPPADPELKALLDDMKRRYRVMHERLDDTPDAA